MELCSGIFCTLETNLLLIQNTLLYIEDINCNLQGNHLKSKLKYAQKINERESEWITTKNQT